MLAKDIYNGPEESLEKFMVYTHTKKPLFTSTRKANIIIAGSCRENGWKSSGQIYAFSGDGRD